MRLLKISLYSINHELLYDDFFSRICDENLRLINVVFCESRTMSELSFCFITPSYANDFYRCELLCKSIQKFSVYPVRHYIIVDAQDFNLFKRLESSSTIVLSKESILPWWLQKIPLIRQNIWLSAKTIPIRGWIIQQVIKIASAHHVTEDILFFVDSDVCFIKEFNVQTFIRDNQVRFYRKPSCIPIDMEQGHYYWYKTATNLLGLPEVKFPASDYINQIVIWRRENVLKLCKTIEEQSGKNWIQVLLSSWNISEYVLYGVFIDEFLKNDSGHYFEDTDICYNYFSEERLSEMEVKAMIETIPNDKIAVMISAKANVPVDFYSQYILPDK